MSKRLLIKSFCNCVLFAIFLELSVHLLPMFIAPDGGVISNIIIFAITFLISGYVYPEWIWPILSSKNMRNFTGFEPNLNGKWNITIKSSYDEKQEYTGSATIKQGPLRAKLTTQFNQSTSETDIFSIDKINDSWTVIYSYTAKMDYKNGIQNVGFAQLKLNSEENELKGVYANHGKGTYGMITLSKMGK